VLCDPGRALNFLVTTYEKTKMPNEMLKLLLQRFKYYTAFTSDHISKSAVIINLKK
jgi:hypothetical protein